MMKFRKELQYLNQNVRVNVSMHRIGGAGLMPSIASITDLSSEYPKIVDQLRKSPVTIELLTKDYSGVKPFKAVSDMYRLKHQESIVNQLAKNRDWAMEWLNTLNDIIRRYDDSKSSYGLSKLNSLQLYLKRYMEAQHVAASKCFEDPILGCTLPRISRKLIRLSLKKAGVTLQSEIHKQYWYEDSGSLCRYEFDAACLAQMKGRCTVYGKLFTKKVCQ